MESTANINNTNTTGIFSEISIKIRYKSNGITITENLGLYSDTNLDNAFNEFNAKKSITLLLLKGNFTSRKVALFCSSSVIFVFFNF